MSDMSESDVVQEGIDSLSILSSGIDLDVEECSDVLTVDFTDDSTDIINVLYNFHAKHESIIAEFADVEIFLISIDALLIELTAHDYLNWTLGGQTIVIANQIDIFLNQLNELGGKFKLIWFTDLLTIYRKYTVLNFLRSFVAAYLLQSRWSSEIEEFDNPRDQTWSSYLRELTPSFLMTDIGMPSKAIVPEEEPNYRLMLASIVLQTLASAVPVVYLSGLIKNFCSIICHRIEPVIVDFKGWDVFLAKVWSNKPKRLKRSLDLSSMENKAYFWSKIIRECKDSGKFDNKFDVLALSLLISTLVIEKRGKDRIYLPEVDFPRRGMDHIAHRRILLTVCSQYLDTIDFKNKPLKFSLADLWDGRFIINIFDHINAGKKVSPYRIQNELVVFHELSALEVSLEVDMNDQLFDAVPVNDALLNHVMLLETDCALLHNFLPKYKEAIGKFNRIEEPEVFEQFRKVAGWRFHPIQPLYAKPLEKIDDDSFNKDRQRLYRWYGLFAQSLESRGTDLLVDFSRTPRTSAISTTEEKIKHQQSKGKPGAKGKKEPAKSKKDLILEANQRKKNEKQIDSEKQMISYALMQGNDAAFILEKLMGKLELDQSRALCTYELITRLSRDINAIDGPAFIEQRRKKAVPIVRKLKELFTLYWDHLDTIQKKFVTDLWKSLGFDLTGKPANYSQERLSLNINMIYYQLQYGGELIDIQSDPQKDERVTGFNPDYWQRKMLDAVDKNNSAVIIAPTSAGKTFVSYYCIEKILRQSDDDVVVYLSPSKALINQVCGSVYARFRNKSLTGGKTLFGTLQNNFYENPLNCQVLVTVPELLEDLLLSTDPVIQRVCARIKYIIFDEVHCVSASPEAHIWEHLLLLCRSPFLALSATIGNAKQLHEWLSEVERDKTPKNVRQVELIIYEERYSELELYLQRIAPVDQTTVENYNSIEHFMPYGIYKPLKLSMFGIPADQQLTARQILELYHALSEVDPAVKEKFEPCKFFNYKVGGEKVWLTRANIRLLEKSLKNVFLDWLEKDIDKLNKVLQNLSHEINDELDYRSRPFAKRNIARKTIAPLVLELRDKDQLPAICFNDDRRICEEMAICLFQFLEEKQKEYEESEEYRTKYAIKDEEKLLKFARRKRDINKKKRKLKGKKKEFDSNDIDSDPREDLEELRLAGEDQEDLLTQQRFLREQALEKFRLRGRNRDEDLFLKMKKRLLKGKVRETSLLLLRLFERGIGFHHQGLNTRERGATEILFRSGYLGIIFSTSTLALGINTPCKTAIFGIDTPHLTPLLFRQMSGRAGRRGYDHSGNVVFMSIPTAKLRRLLTASLSTLRGNLPLTTSFLLRLFIYVHQKEEEDIIKQSGNKRVTLASEQRLRIALTFLNHSFILYTLPEKAEALKRQLNLFVLFSVNLLRRLSLLNKMGEPNGLAHIVCHLSANEPGNLIFAHLLQNGLFHEICKNYKHSKPLLKSKLILILAHIFTKKRLPISWNPDKKKLQEKIGDAEVCLTPMPDECRKFIEEYNEEVEQLFKAFMQLVGTKDFSELHETRNSLQGSVFSLTGNSDSSVSLCTSYIVPPYHEDLSIDMGLIPACPLNPVDHRGNKIYFNAYAADFWIHRSKEGLKTINFLTETDAWHLIHDFSVNLNRISEALFTVGRSKDPFVEVMKELSEEYDQIMKQVFDMK